MSNETPTSHDQAPDMYMYHRLGAITRQLHDALHELGYAPVLKDTVEELPDARSRLEYIARLTGQAAEKVLNRVDEAKAEQDAVRQHSRQLVETIRGVPGLKWAMPELVEWSEKIQQSTERTDAHLTEIMMAQDFHDLTGQVIKKVVALAATIEGQLLQLLLEAAPHALHADGESKPRQPAPSSREALAGPVVNPEGRTDVVTSQQDVDDLLSSLGF
jgi:chemotaxis protein CheZ